MLAAKAGKDVYSEKPCGITIGLCQELADTMKRTGRVFQAGTQRRSVPNFQTAVELAHSGKLGKIHTLYASVYMPQIESTWLPGEPTPARDVCDWNMWLGTAPWRPYNSKYVSRRLARVLRLRLRRTAARLGRPYGRSVPMGQQGRRHHADRLRAERRPTSLATMPTA